MVSTDEKTGIQALERSAPTQPMQPGQVERREFEYERHGTQCLIANLEVATGQGKSPLDWFNAHFCRLFGSHSANSSDRPYGRVDLHYGSVEYASVGIFGSMGGSGLWTRS